MARGDFKADPSAIIRAHLGTYVDARTHRVRPVDHLVIEGVPALALVVCVAEHLHLPTMASVGLLTVTGILSAFMFTLALQVADRATALADSRPEPGTETSDQIRFHRELAANAGYTSIVSILAAVAFVAASASSRGWPLLTFSSIGVAIGVHLVLVFLMVLKRVFVLTGERLDAALTSSKDPSSSP